MQTRHIEANHVPLERLNAVVVVSSKNYRKAMQSRRAKKWKETIKTEFEALEQNDTWEVTVKPRDAKLLHSK